MCHQPQPPQPSSGCAMVESVDDAEGLSVAVERCPLCSTSRRRLTCARCVQAGDFVYFSGRNAERLEVFPPVPAGPDRAAFSRVHHHFQEILEENRTIELW